MTVEEFAQAFTEALDLPPGEVEPGTRLADIKFYDSMGRLAVMSMADTKLGVVLDAEAMEQCKTVAELYELTKKAA